MISCERCGHEMPENAAICPACGTITSAARPAQQPATEYGGPGASNNPPRSAGSYGQGYGQQPYGNSFPPQPGYAPPQAGHGQQPYGNSFPPQPGYVHPQAGYGQQPFGSPQQQQGYGYAPPTYPPGVVNINVINPPAQAKNNTALIAEIICSFFGIYGVGWLMAGETTVGAILLIGSFVYWIFAIVMIVSVLGIFCLIPMGIGLFVLNIILLNSKLDRKAAQAPMMFQTPIR